jgi:predicted hydrocarbon binding protein
MSPGHSSPQMFYLPNKLGRMYLLALEEVIGRNAVNAALNLAGLVHLLDNYPPNTLDRDFRFDDLGRLHQALERLYGPRGGRGLALRTGRASFKYGLREFGPMLGITDLAFRLLPLTMKLKAGVEGFAEIFNRYTDQVVHVEERPEALAFHIDRCPLCWNRHTDGPCCHLAVGFLQEGLAWLSGGKSFVVTETECIAQGDASCLLWILREPLD